MRFLIIKLLLGVFLTSCSLKTTEGLRETPALAAEVVNPYFSSEITDYVYKAKIDVYGRYFGGILIVKKVGPASHRVVFTTEFGSKIFDFLYEGDTFTVNFIVEDLDKKLLVNTLETDFKVLITEKNSVTRQFVSEKQLVYLTEDFDRDAYYFFRNSENKLERTVFASKRKEKFEIRYFSEENDIADRIEIQHFNINLSIELDYFKRG
jgi:hypothetical protein